MDSHRTKNTPPDSVKLPTLKGGDVMEDNRSRIERKRNQSKLNGEQQKSKGFATLRNFADLSRVFSFLESLFDRFGF